MLTFKQFIAENPTSASSSLEQLQVLLALRQLFGLSKSQSHELYDWLVDTSRTVEDLDVDIKSTIIDHLAYEFDDDEFHPMSDDEALIRDAIGVLLKNEYHIKLENKKPITGQVITEHAEPLEELSTVLAVKKELGISLDDAKETLEWLQNDSSDLPDDAYNAMIDLFDTRLKKNRVAHHDVEEFIQNWMIELLVKKYALSI